MDYHHPRIAEIYDLIHTRAEDADFYLSLAGERPLDVLDLGCGTGTLCCALAEQGHRVTGVDPAVAMLSIARGKPHANKVEWVESAAQAYRSSRRFDLIFMTGHAFQTLLTDEAALSAFETMRLHLNPQGRIAFETRNPRIDWAEEWSTRPPRVHHLPEGELLETLEITAAGSEFVSFRTSYRFSRETLTTNSTLRFPSQEQIQALLNRSGLVMRQLFGDWTAAPFDPMHSREMIFIAEVTS